MSQIKILIASTLCLCLVSHAISAKADKQEGNPVESIVPLTLLLSASNQAIPSISQQNKPIRWALLFVENREVPRGTCWSAGAPQPYTIKDLLAPHLANLDQGENRIAGQCAGKNDQECFVKIHHANGEDLSSFELRFKTRQGKIDMNSLFCDIIP